MWIRLHKELRELALPWAAAIAVAVAAAKLGRVEIALAVFAGLCFYLTVRPFGGEFDRGTLAWLLSQPIPRWRIWCEKMLAATVAVVLGYGLLLLLLGGPGQPPRLLPPWLILLVAIATGPAISLLLRDSLRSFWAALTLPAVVFLAAVVVWSVLLSGPGLPVVGVVFLPYCAVMTVWGYRRFLTLEVDTAAAPRGRGQAVATTPRSFGPARELVLKELHLQRSSLLPVPVALAAFVPVWWYFRADPRLAGDTLGEVLFCVGCLAAAMLTLMVPALIGAHAVAWERQLGVLGWHLGLPVSRRLQWRLKLACCLLLTLAVGILGSAQFWFLVQLVSEAALPPTFVLVLAPVAIMACSLYGSRLAGSPFRALGAGLVAGLVLALVVAYGWKLLETTLWIAAYLPYRTPPVGGTWLVGLRLLFHPAWPSGPSRLDLLVGLTLLALILPTPRQESWLFVRRRFRPAALAALLALAVAAFSQIYALNLIAVELDRQIAANDDELASAGGADLAAALAASLDQSLQHFATDLEPIYSYGAQVFDQDPATQYSQMKFGQMLSMPQQEPRDLWPIYNLAPSDLAMKFETLFGMRRPPSTSMKLVALLDGAGAGPSRLRWQDSGGAGFWFRDFYRELDAVRNSHHPHFQFAPVGTMDRDTVIALRPYSLAPLWFHQHRRRQFDLRVRQNLTLDALDLVRYLAHSPAVDRDHLRRLLEATPLVGVDLEPVDRAGLHNLGRVYRDLGEPRRAIELFERAIVIARETGHRQGEGAALSDLAHVYDALALMGLWGPHRAIEPFEQSIVIARELGDRWSEAARSWRLGQILFFSGQPERAGELMNFRVAIGRDLGHTNVDRLAAEVDEIRRRAEEPAQGVELWVDQAEQHLARVRVTGNPWREALALNDLGMAYRYRGEPRRAIEYHEQAIVIAREIGDRQVEHAALGSLGLAYTDLGESRRAIELFEQAIAIAREIGGRDKGALLGNLGLAYTNLGKTQRAIELFEQAIAIAREIVDPWGEAIASWNLGLIYEESGELERAVELMEGRVALERKIGHADAEKHAAEVDEIRARLAHSNDPTP